MALRFLMALFFLVALRCSWAAPVQPLPEDPYFAPFKPLAAPVPQGLLLRQGDRVAICGDSITEQKMYSRIIETYLTVCVPQLDITVRQYGWSGERAPGFLARMTNDVLRFKPTVATTCYGMNDHRYQPYNEEIGRDYRESSQAIIRAFKAHGVRVVHGSAGTVGRMPDWVKEARGTVTDLNLGLLALRNIGVELAQQEGVAFADVFVPMLVRGWEAKQRFGEQYMITGKDGVHPGWAGQAAMAFAFLRALGLDGELGLITVDLETGQATASDGHRVLSADAGELRLESGRYPFCASGALNDDGSLRSGMALVGFDEALNRFVLKVRHPKAARYQIRWGESTRSYDAPQLESGINLAADFVANPFAEPFRRVDEAVARKQAYETRQVKDLFHGPEGHADADATAALTEKVRQPLAEGIRKQFTPVQHTIRLTPE